MPRGALWKGRLTNREIEMAARMDFVPSPGQTEDKDAFISRCMADDEMNGSFPDNSQRAAVCNSAWKQDMAKEGADTFEVELFATGTWNGMDFGDADLKQIVNASAQLGDYLDVPLKLGHNDEQQMTDGQPALGWVDSVKLVGNKIVGAFRDVPEIVKNAISKKLYDKVSIELDFDVEHGGTNYPMVLTGVALLGADLPAVNTLEDLSKYMSLQGERRLVFTAISGKESTGMNEAELKAAREKLEKEQREAAEANAKFEREKAEFEAKKKAAEDEAKKAEFARKKTEMTAELDEFVKAEVITPAYRDALLSGWEDNDECVKRVEFSIEAVKKGMPEDKRINMHKKDEGKGSAASEEVEEDKDKRPSDIILGRVRKLRAEHSGMDFATAQRQVMMADPELARKYRDENDEVAA